MLDLEKISESLCDLYKILDHRLLLTEAFIVMFRKNSCTLAVGRQIVLLIEVSKLSIKSKSNQNQIHSGI